MTLIIKEDNLLGRIKFRAFLANSAPPVIVSPIDKAISKTDVDYWLAQADVILAKNVKLHGEYAFDVDAKDGSDYDNLATVSLNYVF